MVNNKFLTKNGTQRIIFTDLDGSLLDHNTYSHEPAALLLNKLEQMGIPVIIVSSKTAAEILPLRELLKNKHPFITENGAGIYVPSDHFSAVEKPDRSQEYLTNLSISPTREVWLKLLDLQATEFKTEYQTFYTLYKREGPEAISRITGLSVTNAILANQREFSETIVWLSTESRKLAFIEALSAQGATIHEGGRFLSITGPVDKGQAIQTLTELYHRQDNIHYCETLAIGDSKNDIAMLEKADSALIIRSPYHHPPRLQRSKNLTISQKHGPEGWVSGVTKWLQSF
ncbi:MAG: HAD-IIB family hydrolase [Porticoccaceae bacterium]|nr:HAD-IIB family hydrolase [Porticoccaceae bacterium]MDG1475472.1 HAD-IIB family hydrolase [Porticoccaceae bacterium]